MSRLPPPPPPPKPAPPPPLRSTRPSAFTQAAVLLVLIYLGGIITGVVLTWLYSRAGTTPKDEALAQAERQVAELRQQRREQQQRIPEKAPEPELKPSKIEPEPVTENAPIELYKKR